MDALKEYMFSKCQSLQIEHLRPTVFNTTIQNKIGNIRQKKSCVKGSHNLFAVCRDTTSFLGVLAFTMGP
uniref:Uncharacterized protein n=1 Tax=Magallana gigas TaxID=29159 RepID=K1PYE9_MAGGI